VNDVVHELASVDSTNTWVTQHAADVESGSVVFTLNQTAGRGRQGRRWVSPPGDSVAFSVVLDALPAGFHATWVPLLAGVSVVECVRGLGVTTAGLKWPNDVLVGTDKLAGILVEVLGDSRLVVGVGINLRTSSDIPSDIRATSLAAHGIDVTAVVDDIITPVTQALRGHLEKGIHSGPAVAHEHWKTTTERYLRTVGRRVEFEAGAGTTGRGIATGLADTGALIVAPDSGADDVVLHSGDVFHIERS
jgi:BirA family biotin operon repressor/biotin-[acetyl-CoA-carboxylase] ligase